MERGPRCCCSPSNSPRLSRVHRRSNTVPNRRIDAGLWYVPRARSPPLTAPSRSPSDFVRTHSDTPVAALDGMNASAACSDGSAAVLTSFKGMFAVSAARARARPESTHDAVLAGLERFPIFGHVMERAWAVLFRCHVVAPRTTTDGDACYAAPPPLCACAANGTGLLAVDGGMCGCGAPGAAAGGPHSCHQLRCA